MNERNGSKVRHDSTITIPLAIDLFCGLGGWTDGLLAEGYHVVGFDIERHDYGTGGYPAQLVLQDVLALHGKQFKNASLIVCSPPCQEFSYMAMPWTRAKQIERALRGKGDFPEGYTGSRTTKELTALFDACFRIQREAIGAAGHFIPMVVENVRGAEKWVGRARWHYGSFYLWGDVPALMPIPGRAQKFNPDGTGHPPGSWFAIADSKKRGANMKKKTEDKHIQEEIEELLDLLKKGYGSQTDADRIVALRHRLKEIKAGDSDGRKVPGFRFDGSGKSFQTASVGGVKQGGDWFAEARKGGEGGTSASYGSKSPARKAASAAIARIPFSLAQWIAQTYYPREERKEAPGEP